MSPPEAIAASLSGREVLVTGATGFIGGHLVEALWAAGARVRALVRASSKTASLEARGVQIFRGGFDSKESLRAAVSGADFVVHAAGGGKVEAIEAMYAQNRDTTRAALDAARAETALERFVFVSTAAAHGPSTPGRPATEADPAAPRSHYGKAKLEAEQILTEAASSLPVTILRPPAVYGPGDTRMLGLFKAVHRGLVPRLGDREISIVHVQDLVQAILRALALPHDSGRVFFVSDGEAYSHDRMARALVAAFSRPTVPVPVPRWALELAARAAEAYAKRTGGSTFLTRDKVEDLFQPSWVVDSARVRAELGFLPTIQFEAGAEATARWYQAQGWL